VTVASVLPAPDPRFAVRCEFVGRAVFLASCRSASQSFTGRTCSVESSLVLVTGGEAASSPLAKS
jgi:hypothetical protein